MFVNVQGLKTSVLTAGTEGSPVMLLHGGGIDSAALSWGSAMEPLAKAHRVFAADWPGYGDSDKPDVEYSLDYFVEYLGHLMDALELPKASLVGLSMGGSIALGFTLRSPQRVEKLVLVDSYGLQDTVQFGRMAYYLVNMPFINEMTYASLRSSLSMTRWSVRSLFHDYHHVPDFDALTAQVYEEVKKPKAGVAWTSFQKSEVQPNGPRTCYLSRLPEIKASTLVIHGDKDAAVSLKYAQKARELIAGSKLHVIAGAGHWSQRECPDEFNQVATEFLST
jgi:pimeloyl-ACP methyl ester carboxylesterase